MIRLGKDILTACFLGMILPGILLNGLVLWQNRQLPQEEVFGFPNREREPVLVREGDGSLSRMEMDAYLTGVLLAEVPASFEPEALKAQAVAARTYTRKAVSSGGKHGDGSLCTTGSCCQGYCAPEQYLARGGTEESAEKIRTAVEETSGYVLTYEGELIEATYFSCSGGSTEDAAAVWGTDYPYLQSVSSPGEEDARWYTDTVSFTPEAFNSALGRELTGNPEDWFSITTYTEGGGVAAMTIGGELYSGTELRTLLGLRSTAFAVETTPQVIRITTKGYGHRVGLSQYGANAMAAEGKRFPEILNHYYPGALLCWQAGNSEKDPAA